VISGKVTAPVAGSADGGAQSLQTLAAKSPARLAFNFRRKTTTGVRASGRAIARWDVNTKEPCIGSGSGRTMNTNGCWANDENQRR
jgi:hypothetical protein